MKSIRNKTINGVKWTTFSSIVLMVTTPILLFIKTRYLSPEEYGYIAILSIIIGFLHNFEGTGFTKGVIQRDQVDYQEASTLFVFNFGVSILMALSLFFLSTIIATIFGTLELTLYLRVMSILVLVNGPIKYYRAFFEKNFMFKEIGIAEISRQIILITLMPILFLFDLGIWSFVYTQILSNLMILLIYLCYSKKKKIVEVRLYFRLEELKHYMRFGIFSSSRGILNYSSKRIDEIVIGLFLGAEVLGLYHFGKTLLEQIRKIANKAFAKILFPLFSKLKNDTDKMSDVYKLLTYYLALIFLPIFTGVTLTAHTFVPLLFGEQWIDSINIIQVFSLLFILKMIIESLSVNLLFAVNKPDTVFYIDLVTTLIYFGSLILFARLGVLAVIVAYSMFTLIRTLIMQIITLKVLNIGLMSYLALMKKAILFTIIMAITLMSFQRVLGESVTDSLILISSIKIGIIVYGGLTYVFDKKSIIRFYNLAISK